MNQIYFTVGPSKLHPKIKEYIEKGMEENIGSISHRSARFTKLFEDLSSNLKKLLNVPADYSVFYCGSATEFMERIVQNCSEKSTLNFVDGSFSKKFSKICSQVGRVNTDIKANADHTFDIPSSCDTDLICLTNNETTTGTKLPYSLIPSISEKFPEKLIALDIVSSAPICDVDFSLVDCIFFSVQKSFGLPAGLGVLFASPRALEKAEEIEKNGKQYTGSYHSFAEFTKFASKNQTPETPNVLGMYLLNEVCLDYLSRGIENLKSETKDRAELIYQALKMSSKMKPLIENKEVRSETVIVAETPGGSKEVIDQLKQDGFIVASGYDDKKETQIRIANFLTQTKDEVAKLCELISGI